MACATAPRLAEEIVRPRFIGRFWGAPQLDVREHRARFGIGGMRNASTSAQLRML